MTARHYDVLILGGGAAGLAAARVFKKAGKRALIVEGRARLGGRIWTDPGSCGQPLPLELGAEFVHGPAPATERLAREHGLTMVEVTSPHFARRGGRWVPEEGFWRRLARAFAGIPADEARTFAEYARAALPEPTARRAARFVESFHGAPADDISALSLRQSPEDFERAGRARRILGGYGALVAALSDAPALLNARVDAVLWRRGDVRVVAHVGGERRELRAPRAIVALPLGVLQTGLVRFSPALTEKEAALAALGMGHALRVAFSFREEIWEGRAPSGAFWHTPEAFPVWWGSPLPGRPTLTAWAGGPRALELSRRGMAHAVETALQQLAAYSRAPRSAVWRNVNSARAHDWSHDLFTFGAYSYARVKQKNFFHDISLPLARTLFFAGEHAILDGENATVESALRSGEECAKNIF